MEIWNISYGTSRMFRLNSGEFVKNREFTLVISFMIFPSKMTVKNEI